MSTSYDLIVVGGGIVGASAAYHAVRQGASVLLVDREDIGRATNAGAGILAPEMNKRDPDTWFNFAIEAVDYYPTLVAQLDEGGAGETSYARCGMLLVAATEDELDDFAQAEAYIFGRQRARGKPTTDALYRVNAEEAKALFPPLTDVLGAIYYRDACRVDGRLLAAAMLRAAEASGLARRAASVDALEISSGRVTGIQLGAEKVQGGAVVIAGGAWSPAFGKQLGVTIGVEPQRGQIAHWDIAPAPAEEWPIVGAFHGHYMLTFPHGRVVTGATRETGSGYVPRSSAAGIREVIDEALRVAPGLAEARLLELRVGLRPFTRDGLPVLGPVPGIEGAMLATGHGPTGLQLGPYSGKLVAELALGQPMDTDLDAFSVARFG
jgi:D-amino-acid dehydrogenase